MQVKPRYLLILLFLNIALSGIGQNDYLSFLKPDSNEQCRYFRGSLHYRNTFVQQPFNLNGFYFSTGVNIARLFSKKFIAGISVDFKPFKGVTSWKPESSFTSSFNASFIPDNTTAESAFSSTIFTDAINMNDGKYFQGNYFGNIGLQISPFPQKYGGFLLEVKRGYASFPVYGYSDAEIIDNSDSDFAFYQVEKMYSASLYCKPFCFWSKDKLGSLQQTKEDWKKWIIIGSTYNRMNLSNDNLYGTSMEDIVSEAFWNAYRIQHYVTLSLGIGLY